MCISTEQTYHSSPWVGDLPFQGVEGRGEEGGGISYLEFLFVKDGCVEVATNPRFGDFIL